MPVFGQVLNSRHGQIRVTGRWGFMKHKHLLSASGFIALIIVVSGAACDIMDPGGREIKVQPDDLFHMSIYETNLDFVTDKSGPHTVVHIITDSIYPCSNYTLIVDQRDLPQATSLEMEGIHAPDICEDALGPANYYGELKLGCGEFLLSISNGYQVDGACLDVSDSLIHITAADTSFIRIDEQLIWRYVQNSFVYNCGTTVETAWMYTGFRDSLLSIEGVEQFYYPDSGRIPYPRYSEGYYADHPCLFFRYDDEQAWEEVKAKLIHYSSMLVSQYSGVGIYVENYLGEREWSWKHD